LQLVDALGRPGAPWVYAGCCWLSPTSPGSCRRRRAGRRRRSNAMWGPEKASRQ